MSQTIMNYLIENQRYELGESFFLDCKILFEI